MPIYHTRPNVDSPRVPPVLWLNAARFVGSGADRGCRFGLPLCCVVRRPLRKTSCSPSPIRYCSTCHNDADKKGGLDLTSLKYDPGDPANFSTWVKVHDRVQAGEMPPKEKIRPNPVELAAFVKGLESSLTTVRAGARSARRSRETAADEPS